MNFSRGKHVLVVSHDAGGAEILSAWVKQHSYLKFSFLLEGPAQKIFARKLGDVPMLSRAAFLDEQMIADFVLTGTSWGSDLEKRVVKTARARNIPVASFLDHWSAYRERFLLDGELVLPDELWVGDEIGRAHV